MREVQAALLQAVEKVAHGLAELRLNRSGVDSAVDTRDETRLSRTKQGVPGKDAGTRRGTWRHILRANRAPLSEIHDCDSGELDVRAARQRRYLNRGARWSIAGLE